MLNESPSLVKFIFFLDFEIFFSMAADFLDLTAETIFAFPEFRIGVELEETKVKNWASNCARFGQGTVESQFGEVCSQVSRWFFWKLGFCESQKFKWHTVHRPLFCDRP